MILGYPAQPSSENPTQVHVGMAGEFFGRKYRVVGRALLGEMEYGRIYYWSEYYLEAEQPADAERKEDLTTLVYEETNLGGEWRWFTLFDPQQPLTAAEAATKSEGDSVTIDDLTLRITLVRESQVYHTEGRTLEGERVGSRANYFNALSGRNLVVVSWTGDEVEFYRGQDLTVGVVASALGLRTADLVHFRAVASRSASSLVWWPIGLGVCLLLLIACLNANFGAETPAPAFVRYTAPLPALKPGETGILNGTDYTIAGHATVELAEMGRMSVAHEFLLRDSAGNDAWLFFGWSPGDTNGLLFTPLHPASPLTPVQAGGVRPGQGINVDGMEAKVDELFRLTIIQTQNGNLPELPFGDVRFGFACRTGSNIVMARWNEQGTDYWLGTRIVDRDATNAFGSPTQR